MKTGVSSLNANAASYIPLCDRATTKVPESRNGPVGLGYESRNTILNYNPNNGSQSNGDHQNPTSEVYSWKDAESHGPYASSSKSSKKVSEDLLEEDFDMDLAYLQMTFPGFSEESLSHIYLANRGDLENTVEMLNQLELCTGDSPQLLPETLEIGDTSESDASKDCASLKPKDVADEVAVFSGSMNQQPQPK